MLKARLAGFIPREALRPIGDPKRMLLVTQDIADLLDGKKIEIGFPDTTAEYVVGNFLSGMRVLVSRHWKSLPKAFKKRFFPLDLERLEDTDGVDEVWALCFRKPRPGWRLLGRFLERDVFVALAAYDRHDLAPESNYAARARDTMAEWTNRGLPEPLRGTNVDDYLGGIYLDVDEEHESENQ